MHRHIVCMHTHILNAGESIMNIRLFGWTVMTAALVMTAGCDNSANMGTAPERSPSGDNGKGKDLLSACQNFFPNVQHCPIGRAQLMPSPDGLGVVNYSDDGKSGVKSTFSSDAQTWSQSLRVQLPASNDGHVLLAAKDNGETASSLLFEQDEKPNHFRVTPSFTGGEGGTSSYNVRVLNEQGDVVGGEDEVPPGIIIIIWWSNGDIWIIDIDIYWDFWQVANPGGDNDGACGWSFNAPPGAQISVQLPNGQEVKGARLELEESIQNGSYPYNSFQSIEQTARVKSTTVTGERFTR